MKHAREDYQDRIIEVKSKQALLNALDTLQAGLKSIGEYLEDNKASADPQVIAGHHIIANAYGNLLECISDIKIHRDEPVFLLRGQDALAPHVIRQWASALESSSDGANGASLMAQVAVRQAEKMEHWMIRKMPDMPKD